MKIVIATYPSPSLPLPQGEREASRARLRAILFTRDLLK